MLEREQTNQRTASYERVRASTWAIVTKKEKTGKKELKEEEERHDRNFSFSLKMEKRGGGS